MSRPRSRRRPPAERFAARPNGARGPLPVVAVVGRPNVGKSTLFNRLVGRRLAVVEDVPGVTRDRHYAEAEVLGRPFVLVDTGGFDPRDEDPRASAIQRQVRTALDEADVVLCVFDASSEPLEADLEAVRLLRRARLPVLYVANKADSPRRALEASGYYELGLERLLPVSALHGRGVADLEEALAELLPEPPEQPQTPAGDEEGDLPRVAFVGRPNAGKSSLVNRLLGEERVLVDARPGTTVDAVDVLMEREGHRWVLVDTAGMRRKRARKDDVEVHAVFHAVRAIERSDVVVLMIDAAEGPAEQDAKVAGLALDRGCALVVGLNKMDLLDARAAREAERKARSVLSFVPWAPIVPLSARTGRGVKHLLRTVERAAASHRKRVTTGEVNRFFAEVLERHPPPTYRKRPVRLYYVTQAETRPPTFVVATNRPEGVHFSYRRYVANQIRERFGFFGTPIRVVYRGKRRRQPAGHEP